MPELSILMPVYNERATLRAAVDELLGAELGVDGMELIVVDDGSTDGTRELLMQDGWPAPVRVAFHDRNRGKGAAVRTALSRAQGTYTTIMDGDLEYEPATIAELLPPLRDGKADAVYGTRGFQAHSAYSFWYVVGNRAVTLTANALYNCWLSDIMTCHKLMSTELFRSLPLTEEGFGIEPEITARLLRANARIYEVPAPYSARRRAEGKKLTASDGLRVVRTLLPCRIT